MEELDTQGYLKLIVRTGEQLYTLAKELNISEIEKNLPEYSRLIEKYFLGLDREKLSIKDIESLKYVMSTHEKIANLIDQEKDKISVNLKQLHAGKEMQSTYPQTTY
jgi:hypothetical protein